MKNAPSITALAFVITSLATAVPAVGLLNAFAMTTGAGAYGLMAATISISTRHPVIEKLFGPLDKAYGTHKKLGMASVGLLIAHLVLTLAARDMSPLHADTAAGSVIPLAVTGAVGSVLLLAAAASALNAKLPYHLFQKAHGAAAGVAFTILSMHSVMAVAARSASDAPCWTEICRIAASLPWLTVQSAFSADGERLTPDGLGALAASAIEDAHWYACGPEGLIAAARAAHSRSGGDTDRFHAESYSWR